MTRWLAASVLFPLSLIAQENTHPYQPGIDVLNYDFELLLPDTGRTIAGTATVTVRRSEDATKLHLDLLRLQVTNVTMGKTRYPFERDSSGISIPLPPQQHPGEDTIRVSVQYQGEVQDGLIIRTDPGTAWTAFGDNWPNRARNWLPTVDHPSDKATVTWRVNAPSDRTVIANGELIERIPVDSGRTVTLWRSHRPLPTYVMVLAAAPLVSDTLGISAVGLSEFHGGVLQTLHTFRSEREYALSAFADAGNIVDYFSRTIGPFPYEKLAHLQSSTIYGGMENATAIFYSDQAFKQRQVGVGLIAHETAHQWFGDAVTPQQWSHVWLSEGFATYFAQLWTEYSRGDSAFKTSMASLRSTILRSRTTIERPILDTAQTNLMALLNSNSYQKGAWFLHMLRSFLGDEVFFRGIRSYYERFRHRSALSDDLRKELEVASGKPLVQFFDQWLRRPGFIDVTSEWRFDERTRTVELTIQQGKRFLPFGFPLTLAIQTKEGAIERATVEIPPQRKTVLSLPWNSASPPALIVPDPDVQLLGVFQEGSS